MPRVAPRLFVAVSALAFFAGSVRIARAQLVRVSPGPLSEAHKKLDGASDCFNCHTKSGSSLDCFGCHQHKQLERAIDAGRGLHAKLKEPCKTCHQEHKGRNHPLADWSRLGGRAGFRHQATGFALAGMHDEVKCTRCHERRTPRGRTSFPGLDPKCSTCHKSPHELSDKRLVKNCALCHVAGKSPRHMRERELPFDHEANTGTDLVGEHAKVPCGDCHKDRRLTIPRERRTCKGCHDSPHGESFSKLRCATCHSPARSFRKVRFDHDSTGFSLERRHKRTACRKCHGRDGQKTMPAASDCASCHRDRHAGRFSELRCSQCHASGSWKPSRFRHGRLTKFPLTGKHATTSCRSCHRGRKPTRFERHETSDCQSCHAHKRAHRGQFADRSCLECHPKPGFKKLDFDHDRDTSFPLLGKHALLAEKNQCKSCHQRRQYKMGKTRCADCHEDPHRGQRGEQCEDCHSAEVDFTSARFDHDKRTRFPLQGLHKGLECGKCHPREGKSRVFALGKTRCVDCHAADDPHEGKLGQECEQCHLVAKGAPKFKHDTSTSFALTGAHVAAACSSCHRVPPSGGPPKVGWTKGLAPRAVDRTFPVMGDTCRECHADRHGGRFGTRCESCHETSSFADVDSAVHDTGSFALRGVHNRVACSTCHQRGRMLAGLGEQCQTCHWDDDRHRNALGPNCGDCHRQLDWTATKFSHVQTGFALRGAHRTAPCESCHGIGTYVGTPTDCDTCHLRDAQAVSEPIHTAELGACDRCHREVAFVPARLDHSTFRLSGQHRFVRCRNCHAGGTYAGTPSDCEDCHITDYYDPRTEPDHREAGYATACADCHTPTGWRPAANH